MQVVSSLSSIFPPDLWSRTRQAARFWKSRTIAYANAARTLTSTWEKLWKWPFTVHRALIWYTLFDIFLATVCSSSIAIFLLPCCRCWPWMGRRWARSLKSGAAYQSGFGITSSKWLLQLQITREFRFKVKTASNFFLIFELYQISWATYIPENCSQTQTTLGSTFPLTLMLRQALLVTLM